VKAIETVTTEIQEPAHAGMAPDASELTVWLLEGRFFTIDPDGGITSWSPLASEAFGWRRQDVVGRPFAETLLGSDTRLEFEGHSGPVNAVDAGERHLRAEFAFVPIKLSVGYEFNSLLQDVTVRSTDPDALTEFAKARHDVVLALIDRALAGEGSEDDSRAGSLVLFRSGGATAEPTLADNVVSIADATGGEEMHAQVERARRDAEDARVEIRSLEGQLEEARREAQRSRNEADVARQEANDLRDTLVVAQRAAEEGQRHLEESRRAADELRVATEHARIRSEEAQREADSLRDQLREARDSVRGMAGRADDELAQAQAREARAERELAEARAEAARHEAEVAPLRERYQAAQRELGSLRADLESAHAAAAERETLGERRAAELERARAEADELRERLEAARSDEPGTSDAHELQAVRERFERLRSMFDNAPVGGTLIAPDGRFVEVSQTLCTALGYPRERLLSADPPAIVHPDDVDAHRDVFRRILAGEQAEARGYRRYLRADGQAITMRESVTLLRDGQGRPDTFVVQLEEAHEHGPAVVVDAEVELAAPAHGPDPLSGDVMRRALEDELFELHCQPLLNLRTNEQSQHELLIRMRGEDGRLILPEAFLGPARRAGLAHAIDRWVVRQAVRLLLGNEGVSLEVNLSPEAVHDPELATVIEEELAGTSVDPARLVFEVTGNTAADNLEETRALAKRLRALGCRFALDDFRSNFGSFRLVRELPLDYLKLDGELVGSLAESRTSQLIVKALVDVAAGTGMSTVAVFVSDEETLRLLRQLGVDYAQGYAVGRPRPVGEVLHTGDPRQLPSG
jgi:PAS domain S-box-containing protein